MINISLCMIVKNESAILRRCLDSYKPVADEIIIIDKSKKKIKKLHNQHNK